jgi:DNA-binding NarL/FixJ family response regulator
MNPGMHDRILAELTPTERLVAIHVVQGLSNKEIAMLFNRAETTVKNHVRAILRSANVPSRSRVIAHYYQQFLCPLALTPGAGSASRSPNVRKGLRV